MKNPPNRLLIFLPALALLLAPLAALVSAAKPEYIIYVGTYTRQHSKGIYAYRYHPDSRQLTSLGLAAGTKNPSFLTIHPNRKYLYAVNEGDASVSAFAIEGPNGQLRELNVVPSGGGVPCHLVVEKTGKYLLLANYGSGNSVAAFPIQPDGSLGEPSSLMAHRGSSIGSRQRGPHAHAAVLSPDHRFLFVPDLGLDQVFGYLVDSKQGKLTPADPPATPITPGSGPRHMAFHPNGKFAYVNSEMGSLVTAFAFTPAAGRLRQFQVISTLPRGFAKPNNTAEIEVHPNGKFLYVSNRGHDSIAVFRVDAKTGKLTFLEHAPSQGSIPRNFAIDPTGNYMFVANQNTGNIALLKIDQKNGRLTPSGETVAVDAPVCVIFHPVN
ncbi:MAG: lactonase family protein [Acidobacteriota bacterium]